MPRRCYFRSSYPRGMRNPEREGRLCLILRGRIRSTIVLSRVHHRSEIGALEERLVVTSMIL